MKTGTYIKENYKYGVNYTEGLHVSDIGSMIKKQLRKDFPNTKWSVRTDYKSITISLMEYTNQVADNIYLQEDGYLSIKQSYLEKGETLSQEGKIMFIRAIELAQSFNYRQLDADTYRDEFADYGFSTSLFIGSYDKAFKIKG